MGRYLTSSRTLLVTRLTRKCFLLLLQIVIIVILITEAKHKNSPFNNWKLNVMCPALHNSCITQISLNISTNLKFQAISSVQIRKWSKVSHLKSMAEIMAGTKDNTSGAPVEWLFVAYDARNDIFPWSWYNLRIFTYLHAECTNRTIKGVIKNGVESKIVHHAIWDSKTNMSRSFPEHNSQFFTYF
jgi:hypothetical protein